MPVYPRSQEENREEWIVAWLPPKGCFLSFFLFSGEVFAIGCMRSPDRQRETESKKSPPRGDGHAAVPSPPVSSRDLRHVSTHARREFKPPGLGLKPQSSTWKSSDIAITLTTGPRSFTF